MTRRGTAPRAALKWVPRRIYGIRKRILARLVFVESSACKCTPDLQPPAVRARHLKKKKFGSKAMQRRVAVSTAAPKRLGASSVAETKSAHTVTSTVRQDGARTCFWNAKAASTISYHFYEMCKENVRFVEWVLLSSVSICGRNDHCIMEPNIRHLSPPKGQCKSYESSPWATFEIRYWQMTLNPI